MEYLSWLAYIQPALRAYAGRGKFVVQVQWAVGRDCLYDSNLQYHPIELRYAHVKTLRARFRRFTLALNGDDGICILQIR